LDCLSPPHWLIRRVPPPSESTVASATQVGLVAHNTPQSNNCSRRRLIVSFADWPSVAPSAAAARAGQIAPAIIAQRGRTRTGELVETVGAISAVDVVMPRPGIKIGRIGPRDPCQLSCKIRIFKILNAN
jgi:hypothetical protein